tara:strand:- start:348 stop:1433 length:1086 start_codon:yes stop_codon:yes gene_type:complete
MDLSQLFLQRDLAKDERAIGDWASSASSNQQVGSSIGGLLGTYGVPALLGLMSGGLLAGPALLAATSLGSAAGSFLGGKIGKSGAGELDTKFLKQARGDTEKTIDDSLLSSAAIAGATSLASGIGKGAEAGGALQKDIYKPLDWLKENVSKDKIYDMTQPIPAVASTTSTVQPPLAPGAPVQSAIKSNTYTGYEGNIAQDNRLRNLLGEKFYYKNPKASNIVGAIDRMGIRGNEGLISGLDELYRPGAYLGYDIDTLANSAMGTQMGLDKMPLEKQQQWVHDNLMQGTTSPFGSNLPGPQQALRAQGWGDTLDDAYGWQNLPQQTDMQGIMKQLGLGAGGNSMLNVLLQQIMQQNQQQGTR